MRSVVVMILTAVGLMMSSSIYAQVNISIKTQINKSGENVTGNVEMSLTAGKPPYNIYLYKFRPKPTIIKEIKSTDNNSFIFDHLESNCYFIHVKDASGKLTISNPIEIKEKVMKREVSNKS